VAENPTPFGKKEPTNTEANYTNNLKKQTIMKTYIPKIIKRTPEQIKRLKLELWLKFCFKTAYNNQDAQILATNQPLNKWFLTQLSQLDKQYINNVANEGIITKNKYQLYLEYTFTIEKILKLHPMLILNKIRKESQPKIRKTCYTNFNLN
jgi:hypothetical protein